MKKTPKQYAIALYESLEQFGDKQSGEILKSFVQLLARDGKLSRADQIVKEFAVHYYRQNNIIPVTVTARHELTSEQQHDIIKKLHKALEAEIIIEQKTDSQLLGGMVMRYGDTIIDASVKKQIARLKSAMAS